MYGYRGNIFFILSMLFIVSSILPAGGKPDDNLESGTPLQLDQAKKPVEATAENTTQAKNMTPLPSVWETATTGQIAEVSGKVRRVGNDPLTVLIITDSADRDWYLDEAGTILLQSYEQKAIMVKGTVELKEMVLANGKKLGTRRILTDVTIIN
ncbi:MAG: hypothetical protein JEY91_02015 [Spirochaetaceae bacterium]|nr:hypothetical protein [Spirochaetaceae bacterium]